MHDDRELEAYSARISLTGFFSIVENKQNLPPLLYKTQWYLLNWPVKRDSSGQ